MKNLFLKVISIAVVITSAATFNSYASDYSTGTSTSLSQSSKKDKKAAERIAKAETEKLTRMLLLSDKQSKKVYGHSLKYAKQQIANNSSKKSRSDKKLDNIQKEAYQKNVMSELKKKQKSRYSEYLKKGI